MTEAAHAYLNSVGLLVFGAILSVLGALYIARRARALKVTADVLAEHKATVARIAELELKLALINQTIVPISTAFQEMLIKRLTHMHTPEMDALLVKVGPPNTLTPEEEARLAVLLKERSEDMSVDMPQNERDAAAILPVIMRLAHEEAKTAPEQLIVKVVGVPPAVEEPKEK